MNGVVARLTLRSLLGRRRAILLACLPALLLLMAVAIRWMAGPDDDLAGNVLGHLVAGTMIPLLALIAGTGAIGPEIDDGSIIYLLSKPLSRYRIAVTKFVAATGVVLVFGVVPTLIAGYVLTGQVSRLALGFTLGATAAGTAYCALYLALAVLSRHAVVIGLLYAVVWESIIGGFVPGAQALSVQQWAMSLTQRVIGDQAAELGAKAAVGLSTGVVLLSVVTVASVWYTGWRLRGLRLTGDE